MNLNSNSNELVRNRTSLLIKLDSVVKRKLHEYVFHNESSMQDYIESTLLEKMKEDGII